MGRGGRMAGARTAHEVRQTQSAGKSRRIEGSPGAARGRYECPVVLSRGQDRSASRAGPFARDAQDLSDSFYLTDPVASTGFSFVAVRLKKKAPVFYHR